MATCVETGETFVGTELTGGRTGRTCAQTGAIFARTSGNYIRLFRKETIGKPINFAEICGMTSVGCALTGATCSMIVATSGMTAVTSDATARGKR
jgi:hypothetical protein